LYRTHCQRCHGADGRGNGQRGHLAGLPDFTRRDWQQRRSDTQLTVNILEGTGGDMPAFGDRLTARQAAELVAFVRAFAPAGAPAPARPAPPTRPANPGAPAAAPAPPASDFDAEFRRLEREFDDLRRQIQELSESARRPAELPQPPAGPGGPG
jgi:hypothetical protein